jgi:RimJ/RimL family protein N-acetyltransferase
METAGEVRRLSPADRVRARPASVSERPLPDALRDLGGTPTLATPRLRLEPLRVDHADELQAALDDIRLHYFIGGRPLDLAGLRDRYARLIGGRSADGRERWLNWVVREQAGGVAVGAVQATVIPGPPARAQLAWTIASAFQRRGYARESAAAVADWLTHMKVGELVAHIHPDHVASSRVADAVGLAPSGVRVAGEVLWTSRGVRRRAAPVQHMSPAGGSAAGVDTPRSHARAVPGSGRA